MLHSFITTLSFQEWFIQNIAPRRKFPLHTTYFFLFISHYFCFHQGNYFVGGRLHLLYFTWQDHLSCWGLISLSIVLYMTGPFTLLGVSTFIVLYMTWPFILLGAGYTVLLYFTWQDHLPCWGQATLSYCTLHDRTIYPVVGWLHLLYFTWQDHLPCWGLATRSYCTLHDRTTCHTQAYTTSKWQNTYLVMYLPLIVEVVVLVCLFSCRLMDCHMFTLVIVYFTSHSSHFIVTLQIIKCHNNYAANWNFSIELDS